MCTLTVCSYGTVTEQNSELRMNSQIKVILRSFCGLKMQPGDTFYLAFWLICWILSWSVSCLICS